VISDGQFELPGCDPNRKYRLSILATPRKPQLSMLAEGPGSFGRLWLRELYDANNKFGAAVEIEAKKAADRPVVVKLAPCGTVKVRFLFTNGKPAANHNPWLQHLVSPGPSFTRAMQLGTLAAETITLAAPFSSAKDPAIQADATGRISMAGLIPRATYRLVDNQREPLKDFKVEAGKTTEITVVLK
jgi:hypothetical protein